MTSMSGPPPKSAPRLKTAPPPPQRDPTSEEADRPDETFGAAIDRAAHAALARATFSLSPAALANAYFDWLSHLALSPGKQAELVDKAVRKTMRALRHMAQHSPFQEDAAPCIEPLPQDKRFRAPEWRQWPFCAYYQSFLLTQQWWHNATTGVRGVTAQHERVVEFMTRQWLDIFSPSNFIATNPIVQRKTLQEGGRNFIRGWRNWLEDLERQRSGGPPPGAEAFELGVNIAATPGRVVYRNDLIELIQYEPTTDQVRPEPILIVPAWIMKYYILDLSAHNSLVAYLRDAGFTVFMISWRNPHADQRNLGFDDYRTLGVEAALETVRRIAPGHPPHGVGYCIGGTLLAISAAAQARDQRESFKSLTLLAAQIDFDEAGELQLFVNEGQLAFLEDMMWEAGFLETHQMAGAFQLLRSQDMIWSRIVSEYLMGERSHPTDLTAWNADATRMPARMHGEYLRSLYLNNDLIEGRFRAGGEPISVTDIRAPIFALGTMTDHVAPWRSVYKLRLYMDAELTFALTSGGHNGGVLSEPGHPRRIHHIATIHEGERYRDPESWLAETPSREGSWWPAWAAWLQARSSAPSTPPSMGAPQRDRPPLEQAPGTYVLER
ncbi:MAG: alpha/beta fold hydrolase [Neomegalonema sp.]|nr:alpha/beta fold hydrolase [Neomegalonema sp.]